MKTKFGRIIASARTYLDWTQEELAQRLKVSIPTLKKFEDTGDVKEATRQQAIKIFLRAGIKVSETGFKVSDTTTSIIDGDNWYLELLEDAYHTLKDADHKELLIYHADESKSSQEVTDKINDLKNEGIKIRIFVCEGTTEINGDPKDYREVPKQYFRNWVTHIYGNKYAYTIENESACMIVRDENLAKAQRDNFNWHWDLSKGIK